MLIFATLGGGLLLAATLPYWLPAAIVRLRMRIFTAINGPEGIPIPGNLVDISRFKQLYSHPAANGRSRGAALSDLFWYWLSPGPEIHQEHIEPGPLYDEVARTTRHILAIPKKSAEELVARCVQRMCSRKNIRKAKLVRLRDLMMPVWAEFYYELVSGERCPEPVRRLIVGNANDVVTALKCCSLRHMGKRHRLTQFLVEKLQADGVRHQLPRQLSLEQKALYLQGAFFNTAVVQSSEAMAHLFMVLAQHQDVQQRLASDPDDQSYLDRVITETLRLYPLFGISHRITSADISIDESTKLPAGSVLCFNHPEFHKANFTDPERFDPDRWLRLAPQEANYIPFGVAANRPCPAQGLASITIRAAAREMLKRFNFYSSAFHTRSIPNRGPCLLVSTAARYAQGRRKAVLVFLRARDRWEDVWRSMVQLILGTYMVWDARRLRLCQRYFEAQDLNKPPRARSVPTEVCPITGHHGAATN